MDDMYTEGGDLQYEDLQYEGLQYEEGKESHNGEHGDSNRKGKPRTHERHIYPLHCELWRSLVLTETIKVLAETYPPQKNNFRGCWLSST